MPSRSHLNCSGGSSPIVQASGSSSITSRRRQRHMGDPGDPPQGRGTLMTVYNHDRAIRQTCLDQNQLPRMQQRHRRQVLSGLQADSFGAGALVTAPFLISTEERRGSQES